MLQRIKNAARLAAAGLFGHQTDFFEVMKLYGRLPSDAEAARIVALRVTARQPVPARQDLPRAA